MRPEHLTGRLAAGHSADLIVLDAAPETLETAALATLRPASTLFEGRLGHGAL